MKTKECPSCAVEIDDDREVCPICGYEFPEQKGWVSTVIWVMIILMLIWAFL
ncbi:MAG: zinc ribbon domain-containing protein [Balneolales bacterium]